ncbi:hypothetical protein NHQ30_008272 [Ciborinia camelliae]|nr:hypothetical protein NHQ30_008272 [Ciborinia camelliae]
MPKNLAAIKYELGDGHTYEFVEGTIPTKIAPELEGIVVGEAGPLVYFDETSTTSMLTALNHLDKFLEFEGPFDGIIAFSLGAALASTWIVDQVQRGIPIPIKCAVFLSAATPVSIDALRKDRLVHLDSNTSGELISIPTSHLWGVHDWLAGSARNLSEMCQGVDRSVFVHSGGHEVPRSGEDLTRAVNSIRRCIVLAQQMHTVASV